MSEPTRTQARASRRPYLTELSMGACGCLIAFLLSSALPGKFVHSRETPWLWLSLYAVALAATVGSFVWLQRRQRRRYPDEPADVYNPNVINLVLSAMVMVIVYLLLLRVLPQWLHRSSVSHPVTIIEPVRMVGSSERGRGRRYISLPADSALAGLTLRIHSDELYNQIARTRTIEVSGRASKFGIAVHDFRAIPADARDTDAGDTDTADRR